MKGRTCCCRNSYTQQLHPQYTHTWWTKPPTTALPRSETWQERDLATPNSSSAAGSSFLCSVLQPLRPYPWPTAQQSCNRLRPTANPPWSACLVLKECSNRTSQLVQFAETVPAMLCKTRRPAVTATARKWGREAGKNRRMRTQTKHGRRG